MLIKLFAKLPLSVLYSFSPLVYFFTYYVFRYRRRIVTEHLSSAYPDKSEQEKQAIARAFYRNLTDLTMEVIWAGELDGESLRKRVTYNNWQLIAPYIASGQSFILLSSHFANWEWMLLSLSLELPIPFDGVYKPLHNASYDRHMLDMRSQFGGEMIDLQDFTNEVIKRKGSQRVYALMADQKPKSDSKTHDTSFLNRETRFFIGPEKIAQFVKIPVVFVRMLRVGRGQYEITFELLAEPPYEKKRNEYPVTERYVRAVEKTIYQQPESWLWSNRRWRKRTPHTAG